MLSARARIASLLGCGLLACGGHPSAVGHDDGSLPEAFDGAQAEAETGAPPLPPPPPATCPGHELPPELLQHYTTGPVGGAPFEGPAVVEHSTASSLILAFPVGATDTLPRHTEIRGLSTMSVLPRGARVWLTKTPAGDTQSNQSWRPPIPAWSLVVRDAERGRLLFGAATGATPDVFAPLVYDNVRPVCSHFYENRCPNTTEQYSSLDLQGDAKVTISDGETKTVRVGGTDYDVKVMAREETSRSAGCHELFYPEGIALDVRAKDLPSLAAGLPTADLPTCARGNAEYPHIQFVLATPSNPYTFLPAFDGPATYLRRGTNIPELECFDFDAHVEGAPAGSVLEMCTSPGLVAEPAVGQELWVTVAANAQMLRGPNRGPLVAAEVWAPAPAAAPLAAQFKQLLGVGAEPRVSCNYAPGGATLQEWTLAAPSPVVVKSDTQALVTLDGKAYDAWASGIGLMLAVR